MGNSYNGSYKILQKREINVRRQNYKDFSSEREQENGVGKSFGATVYELEAGRERGRGNPRAATEVLLLDGGMGRERRMGAAEIDGTAVDEACVLDFPLIYDWGRFVSAITLGFPVPSD
ncbi:Hypothetical predicted protein [Olea europaea subsp. europaea]|uniref:Uncharacterized protein n=1 Tax=Olea europaea subsp. europaea TaxID=158383 RepID=A0A8S0SEV5_OLEEU|nr:Hypothetical predicted protein [Olea europaea subsp. europaea]